MNMYIYIQHNGDVPATMDDSYQQTILGIKQTKYGGIKLGT